MTRFLERLTRSRFYMGAAARGEEDAEDEQVEGW
jgi:hypothetical protein